MKLPQVVPGMSKLLAICFGLVDLNEHAPRVYSEKARPVVKEPSPQKQPKPKKPATDWRRLVDGYNILKRIGKGGFSEIWLAEHQQTRELVALKVVQLSCSDLEPDEVATLLAEAKFLPTLDCPYLVKCAATSHNKDWLVMVLEYCSGGEVLDHLHKIMKYTEAEAAKLFAQIVSAISYLHNLNLIHRDIKPENVLFVRPVEEYEAEGKPLRIKVIDLGMATLYNPQKEVLGCVGTPGFVAPEVWNDQPQTFAMDIYSLGVMLFIMLTGRKPHSGADIRKMDYCNKCVARRDYCNKSIHNAPGLKDDRYLSLSSAARELLLAMMADDPRVRPTCMEVLRHPFITAVDSNAEAHREMGAAVRGRIRDLHRIRRLHGLRYALHASRPQGGNQQAFLEALEQRRLRLKGEPAHGRESCSENDVEGPCMLRSSLCANYEDGPSSGYDTTTATTTTTTTSATTTTMPTGTFSSSAYSNSSKLSKLFGRPSGDSGVGSHRGDKGAMGTADPVPKLDKLALMSALPEMRYCTTMPPRRFAGPLLPDLSPVPSCDQSTFGNLEEAMLPRNWSAHPVMYEALGVRDQLLEGLALGVETAFPVERAAASRDLQGEMGAGREPFSQEPVSTTVQRVPEQPPTGPPQQAAGMVVAR